METVLIGRKFRAMPEADLARLLAQWLGCARFIWNAKVDEDRYLRAFARKYLPVTTKVPVDQSYAQYRALAPFLADCPSVVLRNSIATWKQAMGRWFAGIAGMPRRKKHGGRHSIWLTSELFHFEGRKLFVGLKRSRVELPYRCHQPFSVLPASIRIRKEAGVWSVSFCYEDGQAPSQTEAEHLEFYRNTDEQTLVASTVGIDRGIAIPVQAGDQAFLLDAPTTKNKRRSEMRLRRLQRRLSKQRKGSRRRSRTKMAISRCHRHVGNIRNDFCHKTSRTLVDSKACIFVLEELRTASMTKAPEPKVSEVTEKGVRYEKNGARAKAGLNRAILDKGWHRFETMLQYKAARVDKAVFRVPAQGTSQECADCGHTHPDNRQSQSRFKCLLCGHTDNADRNAARVIAKRAIKLILDSGTELVRGNVLLRRKSRTTGRKQSRLFGRTVKKDSCALACAA